MDETYIKVKGKWHYLYRAIDSSGITLDIWLGSVAKSKNKLCFHIFYAELSWNPQQTFNFSTDGKAKKSSFFLAFLVYSSNRFHPFNCG